MQALTTLLPYVLLFSFPALIMVIVIAEIHEAIFEIFDNKENQRMRIANSEYRKQAMACRHSK